MLAQYLSRRTGSVLQSVNKNGVFCHTTDAVGSDLGGRRCRYINVYMAGARRPCDVSGRDIRLKQQHKRACVAVFTCT